jgi:isoleucyl-tRNA synthetase
MKYHKNTRRKSLEYEKDLVKYWQDNKTFEKSVDQRPKEGAYVFYDGPPFITGVPHTGNLLSSIIKDAVPRYWTMKGKRVERRWGWDCHGLPAEVFTEKKLGIKNKQEVYDIGLETYINTCRANMIQTGSEWEDTISRIGRWVDFKGAYRTMDKDYMESVWWAFQQLYDKGKIYEGEKVLLYCVRDATPISKAEVAMDNSYQDVTDPSVFVKFKLVDSDASVLAWTTTPWTLPANTAVAVNSSEEYSEVSVGNEKLILATALLGKVLTDEKHQPLEYVVNRTLKGSQLVGKSYEPLFENRGEKAHKIWHADYVTLEEGTGIVHLAPAYGEEDYALSKEMGFPFVNVIDDNGFYNDGPWKGQYVWDANKPIAKELHEQGVVWKITYITHSYPHCHRCGTKLMYRAHPSWFMDIDGQRSEMLEQNQPITWFPGHIKNGRFAKTVETAPDWNLSRDRFWATAMPVWKGTDKDGKEQVKVVGSYQELQQLSGRMLDDYHRPWVDDVTFTLDDVEYKRIDKVLDCWFESGSMPFAQFHYPFENVEKFEQNFPGDFIAEYVGQVRAWFYYLHAISVGLFGKNAFNNVVVTGTVAGNDGRKMSKSFGNFTDPNELMDRYSADAYRFQLLSSSVMNAEDLALQDKDVADTARKLSMIWNMYDFFTLYAEVDGWESNEQLEDPSKDLDNILDRWIISRVHQLTAEIDEHMQQYNLPRASAPVLAFVDDASNWYVRRSRSRFWKSDEGADKANAYKTLHYVLVRLSFVLAPFTPFLAEELYRNLTGGESVHLLDWPETGAIDTTVVQNMHLLRQVITKELSERALAGIKVRQPLQSLHFKTAHSFSEAYLEILKDELNVKEVTGEGYDSAVTAMPQTELNTDITPELKREGLMREVVRQVQNARKQAGLNVDDRITLLVTTDEAQLAAAIDEHSSTIAAETLATQISKTDLPQDDDTAISTVTIEGIELHIELQKA